MHIYYTVYTHYFVVPLLLLGGSKILVDINNAYIVYPLFGCPTRGGLEVWNRAAGGGTVEWRAAAPSGGLLGGLSGTFPGPGF